MPAQECQRRLGSGAQVHDRLGWTRPVRPQEVVPEFVCDGGSRRGEKIDYAVKCDGSVQMLVEVKPVGAALRLENASQLTRYFSVASARIRVLTQWTPLTLPH